MKIARVLLLLAAFQMEIRVKAGGSTEPLWRPAGCVGEIADCHAEVGSKKLEIKTGEGSFAAAAGALLERKDDRWKVLSGVARVKSAEVGTVYGRLQAGEGEAWIIAGKDRAVLRAVEGPARFAARDGRVLEIPEGFEVWVGGLGADGRNAHGVPEMISVEDHLRRLSALDGSGREELQARVKELRERWKDRTETAAALYRDVSDRNLASVADAEAAAGRRRRAELERREENRRLLLKTAFEK